MQQKEFSLHECYVMACYGLRAIIGNGKLEGFSKEEEDGQRRTVSNGRKLHQSTNGVGIDCYRGNGQ